MRIKHKMELTVGGLIAMAYQAWGADRAAQMVQLATNTRLVMFRAQPHCLISFAKGKPA
jgi:hypothetical protein